MRHAVRALVALGMATSISLWMSARPVHAYEPATTHAGLTEQAVLASSLHRSLSRRLGRPLGILEPLQVHSRHLDPAVRRSLWARFGALDPAGGYRPSDDGAASALTWVVAGSVLAKTPSERGRNHFLDPSRAGGVGGLADNPGLSGMVHTARLVLEGSASVRQVAAGTSFDLTGQSSLAWILAPENDQSLPVFLDQLERCVEAAEASAREAALVQALLALGGIVAVLEDAGEPAHVRNDFRETFLEQQSGSPWDRASRFERFVSNRYGRQGVPRPKTVVRRTDLRSFFTAADGLGLADRTHREFFSPGTLPQMVLVEPETTPREVMREARESLVYPSPTLPRLELRQIGRKRYVERDGRRILGYERLLDRLRFFLDSRIYADSAAVLLPEIGGYAAGLIDHLMRGGLALSREGSSVKIGAEAAEKESVPWTFTGKLNVYAETRGGRRQLIASSDATKDTFADGKVVTVEVPAGMVRVAAVLRGADAAGPGVAAGELTLP
jgi:hypothetical protein